MLVNDYFGPGKMYMSKNFSNVFYGAYYTFNVRPIATSDFPELAMATPA